MIKIGAKVVRHARSIIVQLAEVAVPRDLWALDRIIDPDKTSIDDLIPTASIIDRSGRTGAEDWLTEFVAPFTRCPTSCCTPRLTNEPIFNI